MVKTHRYENRNTRKALAAIASRDAVCKAVAGVTGKHARVFGEHNEANVICDWCVEHCRDFGCAPGKALQTRFEDWIESGADESLAELVERLLTAASEEAEALPEDDDYLIKFVERHLNKMALQRNQDAVRAELERGRTDEAESIRASHEPIQLTVGGDAYPLHGTADLLGGPIEREPYLIEETLVEGQPCIVAGPKKTLKTSLMLDLSVSLASGNDFLGSLHVNKPANVLMMSGESGLATLKKNLRMVYRERCSRYGRLLRWDFLPKSITISEQVPRIADPKHLQNMRHLLESKEIEVLIVDTASLAMDGEHASNLMVMQGSLWPMADVCRELGVTFILLHHFKAMREFRPGTLSDIAFSGFGEFARQWLLISRREEYEPPESDQPREHRLYLVAGGSAGHSSLHGLDVDEGAFKSPRWKVSLTPASEAKFSATKRDKSQNLEEDIRMLVDALQNGPGTMKDIREMIDRNGPRTREAINAARDRSLIEPCRVRKANKQSYEGYRLNGSHHDAVT